MYGEVTLTSAQAGKTFPEGTFLNSTDKPFEIHRLIPRITALDGNGVALVTQPDEEFMLSMVKCSILDLGKTTPLQRAPTRLRSMLKGSAEQTWEWADPYYLVKSEQFQITNDADTFPAITSLVTLRVELNFEGFLLTIAPPSEAR